MSKTYRDNERRVYRCYCGIERYASQLPEGWTISKRQFAGRHTVWCDCGSHGMLTVTVTSDQAQVMERAS
jgi:hypothetical protein